MKRRVVCLLLAIVLLVACGVGTMMHATAVNDDDRGFFILGSSASLAFGSVVYDKEGEVSAEGGWNVPGNAGGVLSYTSGEEGIIMGFIQNMTSTAQADVSYAALEHIKGIGINSTAVTDRGSWFQNMIATADSTKSSVWYYCQYGYLLSDLGLDKTGTNGAHPIKFMSGFMLMVAYVCSLIVPTVFRAIITLLQWFNPFQLFYYLKEYAPDAMLGMGQLTNEPVTPLKGIATQVSQWYAWFQSFSEYIIIPMMFFFLIVTLLLNQRANRMGKIRKFLTRMLIIFACVPVCGALYTGALQQAAANIDNECLQASKIIQSTLVDFERWAQTSHLRPPTTGLWMSDEEADDGNAAGSSDTTAYRIRDIALNINRSGSATYGSLEEMLGGIVDGILSGAGGSTIGQWNTSVQSGSSVQSNVAADTFSLISRQMNAEFYSASDFESYAKGLIQNNGSISTEEMDKVWKASNEAKDFKENDKKFALNDEAKSDKEHLNIWSDGTLNINGSRFTASGDYGLSTMSMYNYLNTKFDRTGATMYTVESSSDFVRQSHYSVNLIGSGVMSFLYFADAFVMLAAVTVVGIGYAFSMLISNIKRSLKFISSVPFALMGGLKAGARIITYVAMMLIEIVGTFFIYDLVTSILMSLASLVEVPVESLIRDVFAASPTSGGEGIIVVGVLMIAVLLVDIIVIVAFTIMAMRLRKALLKSFDEMAANVIDKFIDPQTQSTNGPVPANGPKDSFKSGLAQGGGMAAASQHGRNGNKDQEQQGAKGTTKNVTSSDGTGGQGIDGISQQGNPNVDPSGPDGISMNVNGAGDAAEKARSAKSASDMLGGSPGTNGVAGKSAGDAMGQGNGISNGAVAGAVTGAAFASNNANQADKNLGEKLLGSDHLEKRKKRKKQKEANDRAFLAEAMGNVGVANEEKIAEQTAEAKKEAKAQKMKAVAQTAVGVGELAVAASTGDVSLVQDGVKNVSNGVAGTRDATEKRHDIKASESEMKLQAAQTNTTHQVTATENKSGEENREHETVNAKTVGSQDAYNKQYQQNKSGSDVNVDSKSSERVNQTNTKKVQVNTNQKQLTAGGKMSSSNKALTAGGSGMTTGKPAQQGLKTVRPASNSQPQTNKSVQGQTMQTKPMANTKPVSNTKPVRSAGTGVGKSSQTSVPIVTPPPVNQGNSVKQVRPSGQGMQRTQASVPQQQQVKTTRPSGQSVIQQPAPQPGQRQISGHESVQVVPQGQPVTETRVQPKHGSTVVGGSSSVKKAGNTSVAVDKLKSTKPM